MNPKELERLLDGYFDGSLDAEGLADLERALLSDRRARAEFWNHARMEQALREQADEEHGAWIARIGAAKANLASRFRRPAWLALAGAAAVLLGGLWWAVSGRGSANGEERNISPGNLAEGEQPSDYRPVARVVRHADLRLEDGEIAEPGVMMEARTVRVISGLMELRFFGGARVIVEGPAKLKLESESGLLLVNGGIQVEVPQAAGGFLVRHGRTNFRMNPGNCEFRAKDDAGLLATVRSGTLIAQGNGGSNGGRTISTGEVVEISPDGDLARKPTSESIARNLADTLSAKSDDRFKEWRRLSSMRANDPDLLVHLRMDDPSEHASNFLLNESHHPQVGRNAVKVSGDWVEGRWQGKAGLGFRNYGDRARILVPGEHPEVTYAAWVRIDALPGHFNALFFSETGPGEAHWQLSADGGFRFGVRPLTITGDGLFLRAFSDPVIEEDQRGTWKLLTTTYDAMRREVVHFVDGRRWASSKLAESVPLRFGVATLGNCPVPPPDPWGHRSFGGVIDEFLLYGRVLTDQEIIDLYEEGRP
jgi:hypothetical protein